MGNGRNGYKWVDAYSMSTSTKVVTEEVNDTTTVAYSEDSEKLKEWRNKAIHDAAIDYNDIINGTTDDELLDKGLNTNNLQKTILAFDLAGPGRVIPDKAFDNAVKTAALDGAVLYRGSSDKAIENLLHADVGYIGNGIHGDGIYLSTSITTAKWYGESRTTAFIDKGLAKVVTEDNLRNMLHNENYYVQRVFSGKSGFSSYALYKGFNVIHVPGGNSGTQNSIAAKAKRGEDYYVPLTRKVLVFREHTK